MTTADVNGDGKPDLIVADGTGGVAVLLGNGSGGFSAAATYAAGAGPDAVTTADVNGDGKLDLVVTDKSGGISVLLGNGGGGFSAATTYAAGADAYSGTTADVNGGGKPDIVVADNRGVAVLLNAATEAGIYDPTGAAAASGIGTGLVVNTEMACFLAGTHIRTARGEIAVEALVVGDAVITLGAAARSLCAADHVRALAAGHATPIKWIGHRRVDCQRHPEPKQVWPVRVLAGAFAPGVPGRDLWLSPDHAVFVDGVLVPIRLLINRTTIAQIAMPAVTYFHVELQQHGIILADGLPAESYLDTGNRTIFENAGSVMHLHPDFSGVERTRPEARQAFAPLAVRHDQTEPVWRRLTARAKALGHPAFQQKTTSNAEFRLEVAGRAIRPFVATDSRYVFAVSPKTDVVQIVSRFAAPSETRPWLDDRRRLGVSIGGIVLKGGGNMLEISVDHPALDRGWHNPECDGQNLWRWTNGNARLPIPVGTRMIEIQLHGQTEYEALPENEVAA